ncbi:MAG: mechanosensitive ion channel domain-containing protein [archaeon]
MEDKNRGFFLGGILLVFFFLYIFRYEFFFSIIDSYETISRNLVSWIPKFITIFLIIIIAKLIQSFTNNVISRYFKYVGKEKEYFSVKSIAGYIIWTLALIGILSVIIGNLSVWLTSVGLIGFGLTFALQKPILNFVAWLNLLFNKTYTIGDRISVGEDRGDVIEIRMMATIVDGLLKDSDEYSGKVIYIPNASVLTLPVTNYTKSGEYIWDNLSIDVTYESDWKKAKELLKEVTFNVVNKYVDSVKHEKSEKHENLIETLHVLKKHHNQTNKWGEKKIIEKRMNEVEEEKNKIEGKKKFIFEDVKKEPHVRVELRASSVGLSVRYLAHYKNLRRMESEINTIFLKRISKIKNINIAYPHMQIVK